MAILNHGSTIRTADGGQSTTTIVTASNIGTYGVAANSAYYIGTTQNVFNRASGAQTLTGVSIDGNAANITAYTINQNVGTSNTPSFAGIVSSAITNYAYLQVTDVNNFWITPGNANWGLYFETSAGGLLGGSGDSNRLGFVGAGAARFYVDLNNGNGWFGGSLTANTDSRAPIFYDSNDTAYYVDPNSVSRLASLRIYSAFDTASSDVYANMRVMRNNATTDGMYIGYGNSGSTSALTRIFGGGATTGELSKYSTYTLEPGSFRSPIFYDSDNTGYYLDAASTSNLNILGVAGRAGIGGAGSRSTNGLTVGFTDNSTFAANTDVGDTDRMLSIVNESSTTNAMAVLGFRVNPNGGTANAMLDIKYVQTGATNTSGLHYTFNHGGSFLDRFSILSSGNVGIGAIAPDTNLQVVGHVHVGNQTTFENTGGWNKTIYLDGTYHARVRVIGSAYASGKNSQTETYLWVDNTVSPYSGLATNAGSFQISAGFTTMLNSARSPLFYDSDNTAYYCDPASTSVLAVLQATRINFGATGSTPYTSAAGEGFGNGITFGGDDNSAYYRIFTGMENVGGNYSKLTLNWHTGIRIGAYINYGGVRFYNNSVGQGGTEIFSVGNLDSNVRVVNNLIVNGITINQERANNARMYGAGTGAFGLLGLDSAGSFRWQVYGESGNYGFLDSTWGAWDIKKVPNGELDLRVSSANVRVLNAGNYSGYSTFTASLTSTVDARAPIFYDSNNTGYYCDPASNSVLNGLYVNAYYNLSNDYKDIYVYGDVNTYYVVLIEGNYQYSFGRYSVTRGYNWTGPDTWYTASHKGGLTLDWEWSGDTAWGGNDKAIRIIEFNESYSTMVAGLGYPVNGGVIIWLRGGGVGGAQYRIRTPIGSNATVTAYDGVSATNHSTLTTFTAADSSVFTTRANTNNVSAEILARYPVRSAASLYNDNNLVVDIGSGTQTKSGIFASAASVRAPIFYDTDNTAYYIDAVNTSNLLGLTVVNTITGNITGNAGTATILQTARNINGTSFNGSAAITTATWGTARTITIGSTGKSVDGSAAVAWSLAEIGAAATNQTMFIGTTSVAINRASASQTLTGISIDGSSASCTGNSATTTLATKATRANGNFYIDDNFGNTVVGNYNAARLQGVFAMGDSYKLAADGTAVGTLYGLAWSHPNFGGVAANLADHGLLILQNGVFKGAWGGGSLRTPGDVRGTLFYDWDNTGYYCDPASTSNLNTITAAGNITAAQYYTGGWFRNSSSGNGLYNESSTQHFYSDDVSYWNVASSSSAQGIRLRTGGHAGTVRGYFYADTNNDVGLLNNAGSWRVRVVGGDYLLADGSSIRGQIFYDSNDTTYYTDPASFSLISSMGIGGLTSSSNTQMFDSYVDASSSYQQAPPLIIRKDSSATGAIDQAPVGLFIYNLNGTNNTWTKLSMGSREAAGAGNTVSIAGLAAQKIAGTSGSWATGNLHFWTKSGATQITNMIAYSSGYVESAYSFRAPIFYDSNNTAYYVDPSSTSNLVGLTVTNTITGSVSGNAVTAGGLAVHSGTNNEVNKIVRTDVNGYILAGWINTISGDNGTTAIDRVYASSDGYIRYYTPTNFRTVLDVPTRAGSGANGSWGISVTGSSASCTGNSATATRTSGQSGYPHAGTGMWAFYNWGGNDGGTSAPSATTYTTGLSVGSNPGDQAYGFQIANNMWNTGLWTRNYNSTFGSWIRLLDSSNYVGYSAFTGNVDGTQFRDANDTSFYLDPAGTSNLNKFSTLTMSYNDMNSMHVNSPYVTRYNASALYRNGTMGWGTVDCNHMFSNWGSGFIDSWTNPANAPGSSSHYVGFQGLHYNHQNNSQAYGFQMLCAGEADNRFFWRSAWPNLRSWVEMIHTGNIGSQTVATAGSCTGNAATATILQTARNINGTSFNGSAAITTATWGTARTITIGSTGKSVDGSANVSWTLAELGAAATNQTMFIGTTSIAINRASASQTLTGTSIDGSSASCTGNAATVTNGVYTNTSNTFGNTYANYFTSNLGTTSGSLSSPSLQAYATGTNSAFMSFHRAANFAVNFGLDSDNVLRIGGWSASANRWELDMSGNNWVASSFRAPIFYDSNDTGYYTDPASTSILNVVRANSYVQKSTSQSLSGTVGCTIDVNAAGIHVLTLAASTTISSFTYNNRTANPSVNTIMLVIKYGGTASITWTNVLWANGTTPSLTSASGYADVYMLTSYQGGAATPSWIGTVVAQALVSTSL